MTQLSDLEISKALALAIGYAPEEIHKGKSGDCYVQSWNEARTFMHYRKFSYRDPAVIFPIAERYNCFPERASDGLWFIRDPARFEVETTPQKAIAMCVINGAKT